MLMREPAAKSMYRERGWRLPVVDTYAARCGISTLTATSVRTGFHYLDLLKALPDVFVAKYGPTFVAHCAFANGVQQPFLFYCAGCCGRSEG